MHLHARLLTLHCAALAGMGGDMAPPPPGSPPRAGPTASPARSPTVRWENLLRPWREQVQALHEQNARQAAEVAEQRQEWARQLGEMQEQFMSTRTLIEVRSAHPAPFGGTTV